jgi:hypothetical protein
MPKFNRSIGSPHFIPNADKPPAKRGIIRRKIRISNGNKLWRRK